MLYVSGNYILLFCISLIILYALFSSFVLLFLENVAGIAVANLENSPILQADEAGSVTLPVYSGDQTLTPVLYIIVSSCQSIK